MSDQKATAPKIGIVSNSIDVFSNRGKEAVEAQLKALLDDLKREQLVSDESFFFPERIFGPNEAAAVADRFAAEQVDAFVILDSAFPNGNAFLTLAIHPYLSRLPLILTAPPEIDLGDREWTTNAYCGLIMNNYVSKQIGRPSLHAGRLAAGSRVSAAVPPADIRGSHGAGTAPRSAGPVRRRARWIPLCQRQSAGLCAVVRHAD